MLYLTIRLCFYLSNCMLYLTICSILLSVYLSSLYQLMFSLVQVPWSMALLFVLFHATMNCASWVWTVSHLMTYIHIHIYICSILCPFHFDRLLFNRFLDSKKLTDEKRRFLLDSILSGDCAGWLSWTVRVLTPRDISRSMLRR
jgi:hypothetical protein